MAKRKNSKKKKQSIALYVCAVIIAIGAICGYVISQKITANDKFEIVGEKTIEVTVGETYVDQGAIVVSFGKDISNKIIVEDNIDYTTPGSYYIKYQVNDFRFKDVVRYRVIKVVEA